MTKYIVSGCISLIISIPPLTSEAIRPLTNYIFVRSTNRRRKRKNNKEEINQLFFLRRNIYTVTNTKMTIIYGKDRIRKVYVHGGAIGSVLTQILTSGGTKLQKLPKAPAQNACSNCIIGIISSDSSRRGEIKRYA